MAKQHKRKTTLHGQPVLRRRPMMLKEIHEAPERVKMLIAREFAPLCAVLESFKHTPPPLILVAGRGTSDNAATYGRYLFEHFNGIPVSGAALSLFTLYPTPMHLKGALAIGVSQSGESSDVVQAMREAKRAGAFTLAVTNTAGSSLDRSADHTVLLHARKERAVAATKTYVAELAAMVMICRALGGAIEEKEIKAIPGVIRKAIACEDEIAGLVPFYRYAPRCLCLGRGFNYATVREVALKLMETCYVGSSGMSAADFLHGPIAFVEEHTPVLLFAARGPTYGFMLDLAKKLKRQDVDVLGISNDEEILAHCRLGINCGIDIREGLSPIPFATLGQLFACHLALTRGINPDTPRRLRKITRTL